MTEPVEIFLGFDPGGDRAFGWSVCRENSGQINEIESGVASDAERAFKHSRAALPDNYQVVAVGIDAPILWQRTGRTRRIDTLIRDKVKVANQLDGNERATVFEIGSARGALLIGGGRLGEYSYKVFHAPVTETHPKALRCLLRQFCVCNGFPHVLNKTANESDHQWDARTSAYAAWAMHQCLNGRGLAGWNDLYRKEPNLELRFSIPRNHLHYWMPIP